MLIQVSVGLYFALIISLGIMGMSFQPYLLAGLILGVFYCLYTGKHPLQDTLQRSTAGKTENITFEDIGGQDAAVHEITESLEFLKHREKAEQLNIRPIKGLLLSGPPGNGKTLLAKASSQYTDSSFISTSGSEFIEMYAGIGAKRVRKLFRDIRKQAQKSGKSSGVIFIDELDVLGAKRGNNGNHMEYEQTLNQLLVEMDGMETNKSDIDILVIAATNRIETLDPALTRPGRFDRVVNVESSDKQGRETILNLHVQDKPLSEEVDIFKLAGETTGFSGAHLESLVNEAAILALRRGKNCLEPQEFSDAVEKIIMGEEMPRTPTEREVKRIAIHELGHAFVMEHLSPGSVAKVAITSRGNSLGYTRKAYETEYILTTGYHLKQELAFLLAGSKFEEYFYHDRSTGNKDDLEKAYQIAEEIIRLGMSPLGIVNYRQLSSEKISQTTSELFQNSESEIEQIIKIYESEIKALHTKLLEYEKISGEQLRLTMERGAV